VSSEAAVRRLGVILARGLAAAVSSEAAVRRLGVVFERELSGGSE
jgi:hypothetical protein